jgi:hypothetical protein
MPILKVKQQETIAYISVESTISNHTIPDLPIDNAFPKSSGRFGNARLPCHVADIHWRKFMTICLA